MLCHSIRSVVVSQDRNCYHFHLRRQGYSWANSDPRQLIFIKREQTREENKNSSVRNWEGKQTSRSTVLITVPKRCSKKLSKVESKVPIILRKNILAAARSLTKKCFAFHTHCRKYSKRKGEYLPVNVVSIEGEYPCHESIFLSTNFHKFPSRLIGKHLIFLQSMRGHLAICKKLLRRAQSIIFSAQNAQAQNVHLSGKGLFRKRSQRWAQPDTLDKRSKLHKPPKFCDCQICYPTQIWTPKVLRTPSA